MTKDVQDSQPGKGDGPKPSAPDSALRGGVNLWGERVLVGLAFLVAGLFWTSGILSHTFLMCAVPGTGIFLLALGLAGLWRWRASRTWRGVCLAAWAGALAVLVLMYVFAWQPLRVNRLGQYYRAMEYEFPEPNTAEIRSVCHRLLVWGDPDSVSRDIAWAGDETSVPYLLWSMRWVEPDRCSFQYATEALETITNNAPGRTLEAWNGWYEKNRRRSQMAWWAAGFVAEGYKVSPFEGTDAPKAARELLAALGRATWLEPPSKEYLTFNAVRMLKKLSPADVRKAMGEALKGESPAEKRGLARYTEHISRAEGEPMLKTLATDTDRSVRLAATGQTCLNLVEHWPTKDNDAVWRLCKAGQVPPQVLAEEAPGAKAGPGATTAAAPATAAPAVAWLQAGHSSGIRRTEELPKAICDRLAPPPGTIAAGTHGKTAWFIRTEGLKATPPDPYVTAWEPYVLHVEGWSLGTGKKVYSRQLTNSRSDQADSVRWIMDAATGRLYVSIRSYTAAIDVETGSVMWEVGFGVSDYAGLYVLGPFVAAGNIILSAAEGEIVAPNGWGGVRVDFSRLVLFGNRLWAQDSDGRWHVLDFSNTHAPWSEPADQETPEEGHGDAGTRRRGEGGGELLQSPGNALPGAPVTSR